MLVHTPATDETQTGSRGPPSTHSKPWKEAPDGLEDRAQPERCTETGTKVCNAQVRAAHSKP